MQPWHWAMLMLVPLILDKVRGRVWAVLVLGSIASHVLAFDPKAYLAIDLVCGYLVLRKPAGLAQKAIGLLFAGMAIIDIGYIFSPQADEGMLLYQVLTAIGWLQFAIMAVWGSHDAGTAFARRVWPHRRSLASRADIR